MHCFCMSPIKLVKKFMLYIRRVVSCLYVIYLELYPVDNEDVSYACKIVKVNELFYVF